MSDNPLFDSAPDPENPGWFTWNLSDPTRFNGHAMGHIIIRREGARSARMRLVPGHQHSNLHNTLHGGVILGLVDVSLFGASAMVLGQELVDAVTLDLSAQFIGAGQLGIPVDIVTEILKETKRLVFVRGLVEQGDHLVASFTGTLRKPSRV